MNNDKIAAVESALEQLRVLVTSLSLDETAFLTNNSVAYRRLWHTFRASFLAEQLTSQQRANESAEFVSDSALLPRPQGRV